MSLNSKLNEFSPHLFWDVDRSKLDLDQRMQWFVGRVLEYGLMKDWLLLKNEIGIKKIASIARQVKELDSVTVNFIATLANVPRNKFLAFQQPKDASNNWLF